MPEPAAEQPEVELLLQDESDNQQGQQPMGQEEGWVKREGRLGDGMGFYVAMASCAFIATLSTLAVLLNSPLEVGWFALHPILQTLALVLFCYGILTLQPTSQPKTKLAGFARHQTAILWIALPLISIGTYAVIHNKNLKGSNHFTTWHGTLGITCLGWILLQVALGGGSVWFGGAAFGGGARAKSIWKYHRLSGYILFPAILLTIHLGGAYSNWSNKTFNVFLRLTAFTVAPLAIAISVGSRIRTSKMKFF